MQSQGLFSSAYWSDATLKKLASHAEELTLDVDNDNQKALNHYLAPFQAYLERTAYLARFGFNGLLPESIEDEVLKKENLLIGHTAFYLIQTHLEDDSCSLWQQGPYQPNIYLVCFQVATTPLADAFSEALNTIGIDATVLPGPCLAVIRRKDLKLILEKEKNSFHKKWSKNHQEDNSLNCKIK